MFPFFGFTRHDPGPHPETAGRSDISCITVIGSCSSPGPGTDREAALELPGMSLKLPAPVPPKVLEGQRRAEGWGVGPGKVRGQPVLLEVILNLNFF